MKEWIKNNLFNINRNLIGNKSVDNWFLTYNFEKELQKIKELTYFLDDSNPILSQRIWHIINDKMEKVKCFNPSCNKFANFKCFKLGYIRACSRECAIQDPLTKQKTIETNRKKFGCDYSLQNTEIRKKIKLTSYKKYGVENVAQNPNIRKKMEKTCFEKYGVKWFFGRKDDVKKNIKEKYGVDYIQQIKSGIHIRSKNRRTNHYKNVILKYKQFIPCFTEDEYTGRDRRNKYKLQCNICHGIFETEIQHSERLHCPMCFPIKYGSIFQTEVYNYVKELLGEKTKVIKNVRSIISEYKELDIYIPDLKLAIECDGLYYHSEFSGGKDMFYHLNKTLECEKLGIDLIHIFEDEWIFKKEITKQKLKNIISGPETNYNTNYEISNNISYDVKTKFLESHHINGNDISEISIGLLDTDNTLVSLMTFRKTNQQLENIYELVSYISSIEIVNIYKKLLEYFIQRYAVDKIISYADRRWINSKNNFFQTLGFKKIKDIDPVYWYIIKKNNSAIRKSPIEFKEFVLSKKLEPYDINLTEQQNIQLNGYDRIWDCGSFKYELDTTSIQI